MDGKKGYHSECCQLGRRIPRRLLPGVNSEKTRINTEKVRETDSSSSETNDAHSTHRHVVTWRSPALKQSCSFEKQLEIYLIDCKQSLIQVLVSDFYRILVRAQTMLCPEAEKVI